ncbi:hypothetical protein GCM10007989_36690 [Devosia pacifica]|uniref:Large ribosomal subunit protein bL36 n=1 Tax=Devosia pacifica TaxID=1335967 RepID=A0A918SE11_9HYPH|nr:hypothetical protein GCM10007989_36690 [Devosia pacifica]
MLHKWDETLTHAGLGHMVRASLRAPVAPVFYVKDTTMKIRNSLKALMTRHRANKLVRRRGRVYIINKQDKRFKARQG